MSEDLMKYHASMRNLEGFELLTHGQLVRKCKEFEARIAELEGDKDEELLNAFQLVKNGIRKSWLKFDDFKKLIKRPHDCYGKPLPTPPQEKG